MRSVKNRNILGGLLLVLMSSLLNGQNPLFIPPTLHGPNYDLTIQAGTTALHDDIPISTLGFNGSILGPTLIMNKGDSVEMRVHNTLSQPTTVHWHGLHVSPENDGGPHTVIPAGSSWSPSFEILDKASTYWYHPHLHHHTNEQVSKGMAGMIIVRDPEEAALNLPRNYGQNDFPVIIQSKAFDPVNNEITWGISTTGGAGNPDENIFVNGTEDPEVEVGEEVIRLRLLNGSEHRSYFLGLSNDDTFYQIGSDGGLLEAPVPLTRLMISPGERAEILIDLTIDDIDNFLYLMCYGSEMPDGVMGAAMHGGGPPNALNGTDYNILKMVIGNASSNPVSGLPQQLVTVDRIHPSEADLTRCKFFVPGSVGPLIVKDSSDSSSEGPFDINVINDFVTLGNTEIWELKNTMQVAHPFHIHDVQFFILSRQTEQGVINSPFPSEKGRKDVVLVKPFETVRIIMKFETHSEDIPYMYHCHILEHEDKGMMGQFVVVDPNLIYVDKNHSGTENGSMSNPYNTFAEAVAAANDGNTIVFLSSFTHEEISTMSLLNKKKLNIRLSNSGNYVLIK